MLGLLKILLAALSAATAAARIEEHDFDLTQALSRYTVDVSDLPLIGLQEERTLASSCLIAVCTRTRIAFFSF